MGSAGAGLWWGAVVWSGRSQTRTLVKPANGNEGNGNDSHYLLRIIMCQAPCQAHFVYYCIYSSQQPGTFCVLLHLFLTTTLQKKNFLFCTDDR